MAIRSVGTCFRPIAEKASLGLSFAGPTSTKKEVLGGTRELRGIAREGKLLATLPPLSGGFDVA